MLSHLRARISSCLLSGIFAFMNRAIVKANALFTSRAKPAVEAEASCGSVTVTDMVRALNLEKAKVHIDVDDHFRCGPDVDGWSRDQVGMRFFLLRLRCCRSLHSLCIEIFRGTMHSRNGMNE